MPLNTEAMNKAEEPEQFLVDFMVILGDDELTWEVSQDKAIKLLRDWRDQYATEVSREELDKFADYIGDNYEEGDGDTTTIWDWVEQFLINKNK